MKKRDRAPEALRSEWLGRSPKRLAAVVITALVAAAAACVVACGPKDDKPPLTPDEPVLSDPGDAGLG